MSSMRWRVPARRAGRGSTTTTSRAELRSFLARRSGARVPVRVVQPQRRDGADRRVGEVFRSGKPTCSKNPSDSPRGSTRPAATSRCSNPSSAARAATTRNGSTSLAEPLTTRFVPRSDAEGGAPRSGVEPARRPHRQARPRSAGIGRRGVPSWASVEGIARDLDDVDDPIRLVTASFYADFGQEQL